jgi:hypothetical protein
MEVPVDQQRYSDPESIDSLVLRINRIGDFCVFVAMWLGCLV